MFCPKCGKQNAEGANFCIHCGTALKELQPLEEVGEAKVEPTKIEATKIEPTKIEPTVVEPTKIEPTKIEPTKIEPTKIEPTKIEPTEIKPTDATKRLRQGTRRPLYSGVLSWASLACAFVSALVFFIQTLTNGFDISTFIFVMLLISSIVVFFANLRNMPISQEELDKWAAKIHEKHPNQVVMTMEDTKKIMNRFSYWLHMQHLVVLQIVGILGLVSTVVLTVLGVALPLASGGFGGSFDAHGLYVESGCGSVNGNAQVVSVTGIQFDGESTYYAGPYHCTEKTFNKQSTGSYSKSGKTISFSSGIFKGYTLTILSGSKLQDPQGTTTFIKK